MPMNDGIRDFRTKLRGQIEFSFFFFVSGKMMKKLYNK